MATLQLADGSTIQYPDFVGSYLTKVSNNDGVQPSMGASAKPNYSNLLTLAGGVTKDIFGLGSKAATPGLVSQGISALDSFGASKLGMGTGTFIGPMQPSEGLFSSIPGLSSIGLGSTLAGAGIGSAVTALNPFAKNSSGAAQVLGGVGGAAGMFFGGPIGSAIGGFLGSTLGGLIGGKKNPHPEASTNVGIQSDGSISFGNTLSKHVDPSSIDPLKNQVASYVNRLQTLGFDVKDKTFSIGQNPSGAFFQRQDGTRIGFQPDDTQSLTQAFGQLTKDLVGDKGNFDTNRIANLLINSPYNNQQKLGLTYLNDSTPRDQITGSPIVGAKYYQQPTFRDFVVGQNKGKAV